MIRILVRVSSGPLSRSGYGRGRTWIIVPCHEGEPRSAPQSLETTYIIALLGLVEWVYAAALYPRPRVKRVEPSMAYLYYSLRAMLPRNA